MPVVCRIDGCNQSNLASDGFSATLFHRFPKDSEIRQQWLFIIISNNLARGGEIREESKICSQHFRKDDYVLKHGRRILKDYAIPTIFPDITIPVTTIGIPDEIFTDSEKKVKYYVGHEELIDKISRGTGEVEGTLRQLILNTVVENRKQELNEVTDIKFPTFSDSQDRDPLNFNAESTAKEKKRADLLEAIDDEDGMAGENSDTENTVQAVVPATTATRQVRQAPKRTKDCKLLSDFQLEDMSDATKAEKYFNLSSVAIVKQREIIQTLRTKIDTLTKDLNNHKVQLCKHLLAAKKQTQVTNLSSVKKAVVVSQPKTQQQIYVMPKAAAASSSQAGSSAAKFNLANLKTETSNNVKVVKVFKSTSSPSSAQTAKRFKSDF